MDSPEIIAQKLNEARTLLQQGQYAQGEAILHRILEQHDRGIPGAYFLLGMSALQYAPPAAAIGWFEKAIALFPQAPEFHCNLGLVLRQAGQLERAAVVLRRALALKRDYPEAWSNLAATLHDQGRWSEAEAAARQALALRPALHQAHNGLGASLQTLGRHEEAEAAFRAALTLRPHYDKARINLLHLMMHRPQDAGQLAGEFRRFGRDFALDPAPRRDDAAVDRRAERRLRLGYISPDFRFHPLAFFLLPVLQRHDRAGFEIQCFSDVAAPDADTARFRAQADVFHEISGRTDADVADLVRRQRIDILIDVAGLTQNNRVFVLARRPAPVQMTWLGFPQGLGIRAADYRLTDGECDPAPAADALYVETLLRLPRAFFCYAPPADAPEVAPLPAPDRGYVTWGSYNHIAKLPAEHLRLFAEILRAVPESRLVFKAQAAGDASVIQRIEALFEGCGVSRARLRFTGGSTFTEYLRSFHDVDILLDSFPFNGHTNTCHALHMGVPTVTRAGAGAASRMGATIMRQMGLSDWVAAGAGEFVSLALAKAAALGELAALRTSLRQRLLASPLCDAAGFTRDFEALLRQAWRSYCAA